MPLALRRRVTSLAVFSLVALLASVLTIGSARGRAATPPSGPAPIAAQVLDAQGRTSALVHVKGDSSLREGLSAARSAGLDTGTVYDSIKVFVAYGRAAQFQAVAKSEAIEHVEANRRVRMFTNTSHTATRGQDVLDGAVTMPNGAKIDGSGVGVAVVDSGIDGTHPDFAGRMGGNVKIFCTTPQPVATSLTGFTECLGPKEAVPLDDTDTPSAGGHGTHVAGIVAGTGAASGGTYHGAAPGATLYGVSVGTVISVENGLDGLAWVLENHDQVSPAIKVVNNSWGSDPATYKKDGDVFYDALWKLQEALVAEGVTVVFAAGNGSGNGTTQTTSGQCVNPTPGVLCVANYSDANNGTRAGSISSSSSRGTANNPLSWPDVSAPGSAIISTCRLTLPVCDLGPVASPPNSYASMSGTSMAAPHVAGIIAQLYQANPSLTPAEVENVLEDTAHKFAWGSAYGLHTDPFNPDDTSSFEKGHGLVDVVAAVQAVLGGTEPTPTPTIEPSATPTPTATTTPTEPPTGTTQYYFHSFTGFGNTDALFVDGSTFDTTAPGADTYAESYDIPVLRNGVPEEIADPYWTGSVDGEITSLTLDFWAKVPVGDLLFEVNFDPSIWVGSTQYKLPRLTHATDKPFGNAPSQITKTYTTMLDASGKEVPLSIDPGDSPVTIQIAGAFIDEEVMWWVVYDNIDYQSGFSIGTGTTATPSPTPTIDPSATPTATPTATPVGRGTYPAAANDTLFGDQWGMQKIEAPAAWGERNATGFGVKIAVVDSGLDLGHPDFACPGKLLVLPGSDVSDGDSTPQDTDGHGTHTAGIAGACTNNGKGVVGVAPDATIMPVRAIGGAADLDKAMADGITFATDHGAHVINLSIGDIPPFSHLGPDGYPLTEEALEHARSNGVVIAAAAGNFAQPTCEYPSLSRNVICVVATDRDDMRAFYSDFPVNVDRNSDEPGLEPVVAAPGGDGLDCAGGVTSTYLRSAASTCHSSGYDSLHGTSMSAPHVAGIAALVYDRLGGVRSEAAADTVVQTILDTSDDLYSPGWDPIVGYGRVNALKAVQAITVVEPTTSPTPTPTSTPDPVGTSVVFTDNTDESGQYSDTAQLEALLTNTDTNQPIPGAELVFELVGADGTRELTATTGTEGLAQVAFGLTGPPGSYSISVRYAGQDGVYEGSADLAALTVDKEDTTTTLTVQGNGSRRTLTARVADQDTSTTGVAGRTVRFFADGTLIGSATTNADGVATLESAKKTSGNRGFEAVFEGDDFYKRSSGTA